MPEHAMTQNRYEAERLWKRSCSLVLADKNGKGLELGDMRVTFKVKKGEVETPNNASIRVYNLSEQTAALLQKEHTRVILQAGYEHNAGLVFSGSVIQYRRGLENGTDKWLEIWASDGDQAYNLAAVNISLAAGSTSADQMNACMAAFAAQGAIAGAMPATTGNALPRGKVMYGPAKAYMRKAAEDSACTWSIQNGKVEVLENSGYLPGQAVDLNYASGLVGSPEQTDRGIKARCLINPRLRIGGRIRLNNKSIVRARQDIFMGDLALPSLDRDGFYRVLQQEISGDTRGNDWYMDNVCIGLDDTANLPLDMVN